MPCAPPVMTATEWRSVCLCGNSLLSLTGLFLTARWHNPLEPQIRHQISIMFIHMRRIDREHSELCQVEVHHFRHLCTLSIGHAGVRLLAISNCVFDRRHQVCLTCLSLLDVFHLRLLARGCGAEII